MTTEGVGTMNGTKAKFSFWLDGGYDFNLVRACRAHPDHEWWTFRVGDVIQHPDKPDELMTICRACYVPRCGATGDEPIRCVLWRHHHGAHVDKAGHRDPVAWSHP